MAFGVLDTRDHATSVRGTSQLEEFAVGHAVGLKKRSGGDSDVVLVPQPSNNPNDPLNWPLWQRDLMLLLLCYCTNLCVGGVGPVVAIIAVPLIEEYHVDYKAVSLLTGYQLAVVAAIAPLVSALARKFGKRPQYLFAVVCLLVGSVVCGEARTYDVMLGGRLLQGFGTDAFESIAFTTIGDLYFVHQRGLRMALFVSSLVGFVLLPSLITGIVATHLLWRWVFRILSIFIAVATVGIVLFGWETTFHRRDSYGTTTLAQDTPAEASGSSQAEANPQEKSEVQQLEMVTSSASVTEARQTYLQRIKPWQGVFNDESVIKLIIRPFYLLTNPVVTWAVILGAFAQLWNVAISILLAQLFTPPPYSLSTAQLGYLNAGPIIGGFVACIFCGLVSDWSVLLISKRNKGIYEPEFRLLLIVLAPILSSIGYFTFGRFSAEGRDPVLLSLMWGIAFASAQVIGTATGSYLIDAYREIDVDVFVLSMCFKNFLFFAFSFFVNDWISQWGATRVFDCIGGVMLGLSFTTIPVYIYGKRARAWWHGGR